MMFSILRKDGTRCILVACSEICDTEIVLHMSKKARKIVTLIWYYLISILQILEINQGNVILKASQN